jgi:Fe-S cluster biosynthesis and repair protein YggX
MADEKRQDTGFTCSRCGLTNPILEEPPFETPLGKTIQEKICRSCWGEWMAYSVKVINEYMLNLATEQGSQVYDFQMKEFLGLPDA